ncbi:S-4TM family putative pore-forming effector [Dactylosporangium sp. NPDC005555]|uniref:S-4TM family putative pore-forming effector n=1 Tax=Dactylosporangium sp. NPDC005555 TaxID=3154889 RepID=UPI0033BD01CA
MRSVDGENDRSNTGEAEVAEHGDIGARQNSDRFLTLHRAIRVAHRRAQRAQTASIVMSLLVACLSIATPFASWTTPYVVLIGAAWAAVYAVVVVPWAGRYLRTSATLQEMYDVGLFGLPWNTVAVGDPVPEDEVSRLDRRFRENPRRLHDYYLVAQVRPPYDVLFCLEQNLAWGTRVRRRFADLMVAVVVLWCVAGVAGAVAMQITVADLVAQWFIASLGLLLLCLDIYRLQVSATTERTRVLGLLRSIGGRNDLAAGPELTAFFRQVQDVLFQLRRSQPRVPTWFFNLFHDDDLADFQFKMRALEERVGRTPQPAGSS